MKKTTSALCLLSLLALALPCSADEVPASPTASESAAAAPAESQPEEAFDFSKIPGVEFQHGPTRAMLGDQAAIQVPEGFVFTGRDGTQKLMSMMGNLLTDEEQGFLAPKNKSWFIVFEYENSGYIKDDEKDQIDAEALLKSFREGTEHGNKMRAERGIPTLELVGWETPPAYNPSTHNLEWATRLRSADGSIAINHNIRLLGREGVMRVVVVGDPADLAEAADVTREMLVAGYSYNQGKTYAEFKKGDKIAEYGLMGLIAGGAGVVAAKSGLLAKFWKLLLIPIVAVGAWVKKLFKRNDISTPA